MCTFYAPKETKGNYRSYWYDLLCAIDEQESVFDDKNGKIKGNYFQKMKIDGNFMSDSMKDLDALCDSGAQFYIKVHQDIELEKEKILRDCVNCRFDEFKKLG